MPSKDMKMAPDYEWYIESVCRECSYVLTCQRPCHDNILARLCGAIAEIVKEYATMDPKEEAASLICEYLRQNGMKIRSYEGEIRCCVIEWADESKEHWPEVYIDNNTQQIKVTKWEDRWNV